MELKVISSTTNSLTEYKECVFKYNFYALNILLSILLTNLVGGTEVCCLVQACQTRFDDFEKSSKPGNVLKKMLRSEIYLTGLSYHHVQLVRVITYE